MRYPLAIKLRRNEGYEMPKLILNINETTLVPTAALYRH